jgi:choline transport protein
MMTDATDQQLHARQASPVRTHPGTADPDGKLDAVVDSAVPEKYRGSDQDKHDMIVHGNKQETRRNFKLLTMTGFASMVVCAWEGLLPLFNYVLIDGGTALMFWGFIGVAISMSLVYLSIAEMASM